MTSDRERRPLARFFSTELAMWRGEAPLAQVFWLHGVLLSSLLVGLYGGTIYFAWPLGEQFLLICLALYTSWILVSIWRSAAGVDTIWSLLARMLTLAWAVNTALLLLFRELELVMLFLGD